MAAESSMGNIRGITIKLGGDSSGLTKAFKEVNTAAKQTGSALKDVNKLLKLDPGNLTLLKQKQDLLNRTVAETAEKLKLAEQAKQELLSKGDTEKNRRQIEAVNREIEDLKRKLGEAKKEAEGFSVVGERFKAVGNNIKAIGSQITSFGSMLSTRVTAPIIGAATATMAAWRQVDNAYDTVIAKTGATGKALEELKQNVDNVATSIPTSFEDAGIAIGEVNTRFGVTGDKLEELSEQFLKFAKLNQVDVNSSIDSVQKSMAAFGLSADEAGDYLDMLNKVGQDTGINVGKLSDTMMYNSTALRSMGMNAADAAVLLGALEKSGADTSLVMSGFAKVQKEAMESGVTMQQAFREALSSSDKAIEIFGAKAGPKLYELFNNGTLSIDMFTGGVHRLDEATGNLNKTFDAVTSPTDKLKMAMNELLKIGHELGETIGEELAPVITEITGLLKEFSAWFKSLDPSTRQAIVRCAAIVGALGPVIVVVGSLVSAIGSIVNGIGAVVGAGAKLWGFLTTTSATAGGTAGAVGGLTAAFATLKGAALGIGSTISGAFAAIGTALTTTIAGPIALAVGGIAAAGVQIYRYWDPLGEMFSTLGQLIKAKFNEAGAEINLFATKSRIGFNTFSNNAREAINIGMANVKTAIQTGLSSAKSFIDNFGINTRNAFQTTWSNVQSRVSGAMNSVRTSIQSGLSSAQAAVSSAMSSINSTMSSVWGSIQNTVGSVTNTIKSNVSSAWSSLSNTISGHVNSIKNDISSTFSGAMDTVKTKMNSLKSDSASVWSNIVSNITGAVNSIKNAINNTVLKFGSVTIPTFSWSGKNDSTTGTTAKIKVGSETVKYASAMMGGAILKGATIFGAMGDKLLQAGEVGSEVVVGTNSLMNMIARTARANSNNATLIAGVGAIYTLLTQYLPDAAGDKSVVLDTGKLVGALTPSINRQLGLMMG